jgi:hypothetical protein
MGLVNLAKRSAEMDIDRSLRTSGEFFSFAVQKLVDSQGNEATEIKSASWNFNGPTTSFHPQNKILVDKYSTVVSSAVRNASYQYLGSVQVELSLEFFLSAGKVGYGNTAIQVFPGSVKFTCTIKNWPFASSSDRLYLGIASVASGSGGISVQGTRIIIGDGYMDTPFFAQKDASKEFAPIQVLFDRKSLNQAMVLFEFPAFSSSLVYDPVVSLNSNPFVLKAAEAESWFTGAAAAGVIGGASVFGLLALGGAVYYVRRRKQVSRSAASTKSVNFISPKTNTSSTAFEKNSRKSQLITI